MIPCVVFLNELSYRVDETIIPAQIVPVILSTLSAIRAALKIREDLTVVGNTPLSKITIGDGTHSLASLLRGDNYKDEWRFIRGLEQSSPGDDSWSFDKLDQLEVVTYEGTEASGMLWANRSRSLVLSLGFPPHWGCNEIAAQLEVMADSCDITITNIRIPNISIPEHTNDHRELLANFGKDESASSIIYQGDEFVVRMYFNDHNPPHFHVFLPGDQATTLATVSIDTLDVLSGHTTGSMLRRIRDWALGLRGQLMDNWTRCRNGQHPVLLNS
jgi:hypothetical protein